MTTHNNSRNVKINACLRRLPKIAVNEGLLCAFSLKCHVVNRKRQSIASKTCIEQMFYWASGYEMGTGIPTTILYGQVKFEKSDNLTVIWVVTDMKKFMIELDRITTMAQIHEE